MEASGTVAGVTALFVASWALPLSYRLLSLLRVGAGSEPPHGCCSHRALLRAGRRLCFFTLSLPWPLRTLYSRRWYWAVTKAWPGCKRKLPFTAYFSQKLGFSSPFLSTLTLHVRSSESAPGPLLPACLTASFHPCLLAPAALFSAQLVLWRLFSLAHVPFF